MLTFNYKGAKIIVFADNDVSYFLVNYDGEIEEYRAHSVESAKHAIDIACPESVVLDEVIRYLDGADKNYVIVDKSTGEPSVVWSDTKLPVVYGDITDATDRQGENEKVITELEYIGNYIKKLQEEKL